jgi:hypothetical protein
MTVGVYVVPGGHRRCEYVVRQYVRLRHQVNPQVGISLFAERPGHGKSTTERFPNSAQRYTRRSSDDRLRGTLFSRVRKYLLRDLKSVIRRGNAAIDRRLQQHFLKFFPG